MLLKEKTRFKCAKCGERFTAPYIELGATCIAAPMKCPKCGSMRTRPSGQGIVGDWLYKKVWDSYKE